MKRALAIVGAACLGAGLTWLLDPGPGPRRRARVRDTLVSAAHSAADAVDTTSRDVGNRARGLVSDIRSRLTREPVSDEVLVERVRSKLGHAVSHPGAIEVTASGGRVRLSGPVLAAEADRLVTRVAAVPGVRGVEDRLDVHDSPDGVPALQGAPARRVDGLARLQRPWSPAARLAAGTAGVTLAAWGLVRGGVVGSLAAAVGLAFLARAAGDHRLPSALRLAR